MIEGGIKNGACNSSLLEMMNICACATVIPVILKKTAKSSSTSNRLSALIVAKTSQALVAVGVKSLVPVDSMKSFGPEGDKRNSFQSPCMIFSSSNAACASVLRKVIYTCINLS